LTTEEKTELKMVQKRFEQIVPFPFLSLLSFCRVSDRSFVFFFCGIVESNDDTKLLNDLEFSRDGLPLLTVK
jgi:hypothetical protein